VVRFDYDAKLPEGKDTCFQVALLYTNRLGERRLRVHTLSLRTSTSLADIFRGADMDATLTTLPKMIVNDTKKTPLAQLRGKLTAKTVGILACYRKHCTTSSTTAGQLILPEGLKLLPAYMNCVLRSDAFRKGAHWDKLGGGRG
jgi:protein transport protein SEC24